MLRSSLARIGKNSLLQIERFISDIGSVSSMSAVSVVTAQGRSGLGRKSGPVSTRVYMMQSMRPRQVGRCSFTSSYCSGHGMHASGQARFGRQPSRDVRGFSDSNGGGGTGGGDGGGKGGDGGDESSGKGFFGMLWVMYLGSLNKNPVRWCLVCYDGW